MQAIGSTIITDISNDRPAGKTRLERLAIGDLMDEATRLGSGKKGRASSGHDG